MNETVKPLIEVLAEVPDFRRAEGKRHSLPAILVYPLSWFTRYLGLPAILVYPLSWF